MPLFRKKKKRSPSFLLLLTEPNRAILEYGLYKLSKYILKQNVNPGDGHPVLVIPGFMASDTSTIPLRGFLNQLGYVSYGWEQGRNRGSYDFVLKMIEKVRKIHDSTGKKVSIIGWSLGGVYAREISKELPQSIRQVITLGSPFAGLAEPNNASWLYALINGGKKPRDLGKSLLEKLKLTPPVPSTAIYTKGDGIVHFENCMELEESSITENIKVFGSHLGLGHNPYVLYVIADRLAQPANHWIPFKDTKQRSLGQIPELAVA